MDLTLPEEIPGALLGYRRNGQPIYLAAGGDETADGITDDNAEVEPETGDADEDVDWKAKYEESEAERKAQVKINKDIEKRYKREARQRPEADDVDDERVEAARNAAIERELEAAARAAAYKVGGRAPELLDSLKFRRLLDKLDVEDADEFEEQAEELMRAEVKKLPAKAPPKKQGADVSGGGNDRERPKSVREALGRKYGN